jgi:hypothetical protein
MKNRYRFTLIILALILFGVLIWKQVSKPLPIVESLVDTNEPSVHPQSESQGFPEVMVGSKTISPDDLQWELDLHTKVPKFLPDNDTKEKDPVVQLLDKLPEGPELRERIVSSVLERKIAYLYIEEKSRNFNLSDPHRFTKCLATVNEVAAENPEFFTRPKSRERLKTKLCEQSLIEQFLEERVFSQLSIAPSEINSYYRTHEKEFRKPNRIKLRQVVVAKDDEAQRIRKEIKSSNFSALARKYSITPEASNGGLIGPFSKEQLPSLFDMVFSMNIGEISGVIKSEYGFHIMMPVEKIPAQTLSLNEVAPQIRAEFKRTKRLDAYQKWLSTAMNAVPVTSPTSGISQ